MMKRLPSALCMCGIMLTLSTGCSIKEDRSGCPCLLVMDLGEVDEERFHRLAVRVEAQDGYLFHDYISGNPFPSHLSFNVPRGEVSVDILSEEGTPVFTGITGGLAFRELYVVPEDSECPPVYMQTRRISAIADSLHLPVRMLKNYCRINVEMAAEGPFDFDLAVAGNIKGYDVDGGPVAGDFRHAMPLSSDGKAAVNVPRQTDASLKLLVVDGENVLREFSLGEYLVKLKYDWSREELKDVDVLIDYARTAVTVKVEEWEMTFEFNITL